MVFRSYDGSGALAYVKRMAGLAAGQNGGRLALTVEGEDIMDLGLLGKSAVVVGGTRGIGKAIAARLAGEGAKIAICARNEDRRSSDRSRAPPDWCSGVRQPCDAGQAKTLEDFLDAAKNALGNVDILVNNASGFGLSDDEEGWKVSLSVNLMASVRATWKVVPWMAAGGGGAIINISSIAGMGSGWPELWRTHRPKQPSSAMRRRWRSTSRRRKSASTPLPRVRSSSKAATGPG